MSLDPTVYEFCALTASEAQATEFARQHRLLLSNVDLGRQQFRNGFCIMGTANCTGIAHAGHRSARGKYTRDFVVRNVGNSDRPRTPSLTVSLEKSKLVFEI